MELGWLSAALGTALTLSGAPVPGPLSPERALATFDTEPGLRVELVAAEPLIESPCALAFDEQGRLYVAENRGYPLGGPNGESAGRVALLEDSDGDGRMDKRTDFAVGLSFPNGVMPWRGGVIVPCAPDVFYFKDSDGDGAADVKEVLLTGFATNQSTQLRVNTPLLGPDGWVYLASGLSGGRVTSPKRPEQPALDLKGDLRFKPDTGEFEGIDGKSQYGQSFDDFGRRFGVFNRVQVQHFVFPSRYLERHPLVASPGTLQNCPDLVPNTFMRGEGGAARLYPISENVTTADSHAGYFTSACGIHIYRGEALPAVYQGGAFSCDPTGNLVHYDRLEPSGASFAAKRIRDGTEFLRSADGWFRPVFLATGPDGALYVADMYRKTIEHPEYLPEDVRKRTDFESGKGMGRIWRVQGVGSKPHRAPLDANSPASLLSELSSANGWRRDTALRLLLERADKTMTRAFQDALATARHAWTQAALLFLLDRLGGLDEATLIRSLVAGDAGVREVALRLAEPRLKASPKLQELTLQLADDPAPRVRLQSALALGEFQDTNAVSALARIAARDGADRWTRAAILSSIRNREVDFTLALFNAPERDPDPLAPLALELGRMVPSAVPLGQHGKLFAAIFHAAPRRFEREAAFLAGVGESHRLLIETSTVDQPVAAAAIRELFVMAERQLADPNAPPSRRLRAAELMSLAGPRKSIPVLLPLLSQPEPAELQSAAVRALAQPHNPGAAQALLSANLWAAYSPALRATVLSTLFSRAEHLPGVLAALESGTLPVGAVDSTRRQQLLKHQNDALRQRAEKLFAAAEPRDRAKAYEEAKACLTLPPVPANGREVFRRACAQCHRLEREGFAVGPDLFDIRRQPKESILHHLIIPEAEINPTFTSYLCETKDGRTLTGILAADTPASITLRQAQGLEETVLRSDIVRLEASALSLMPQALEKTMTLQELADLLAFLKGEAGER